MVNKKIEKSLDDDAHENAVKNFLSQLRMEIPTQA